MSRCTYAVIATVACIAIMAAGTPLQAQRAQSAAREGAPDSTCAACRDFYTFANRVWLDTATIPPSRGDWGAWSANDARVVAQVRAILDPAGTPAAARHRTSPVLLAFNAGCMDSTSADRTGIRPLEPMLARIASMQDAHDVMRVLAELHRDGVPALFRFTSDVDRTGDLRYAAAIETERLPLSRDALLGGDSTAARRRDAYAEHVARILVLAGTAEGDARRDAARILAIDTALARASMTNQQRNDQTVQDMYRRFSPAQVATLVPGVDWRAYTRARGAPGTGPVVIAEPEALSAAARLLATRPVADWRAYLRWRVLDDASPYLSQPYVDEAFRYARTASGVREQSPRWQRCARETSADLPELLGRAYVERTFSPSSKARIAAMVADIRAVLVERLATVPWLTPPTRLKALAKARSFGVRIAYPDRWHDYGALRVAAAPFVVQRAQARRFENDRLVRRIGSRPDRAEWDFHGQYAFVPQSPTAWANWDEIIFPAAYLQPPLYDSTADAATNFGAIGVVIGHEMTHLFTADGGDIEAGGRIRHWWTAEDSTRFAVIQRRLVRQYDGYTLLDSATHVDGAFTLGENLADVGGVELAFAAMQRAEARRPRLTRTAGDTTPETRFFLAYAHGKVSKSRPEHARRQLASDPHAPSMFRVNGPLSNFDGFARTFGCGPRAAMVRAPDDRVAIW